MEAAHFPSNRSNEEQILFFENMNEKWPNFFFVGAGKASTSSIYSILTLHPGIFLPEVKEPCYFSDRLLRPEETQISKKKYLSLYKNSAPEQLAGDFSTRYFICSKAPKRIHTANPNAKILIILRDPLARAYSDFLMLKTRRGLIKNNFIDSVTEELKRLDANIIEWPFLVLTSLYHRNIMNYLKIFDSKNVFITYTNTLKNHPAKFYDQIFDFLNVEKINLDEEKLQKRQNVHSEPRSTLIRDFYFNKIYKSKIRFLLPKNLQKRLNQQIKLKLFKPAEKQPMPEKIVPILQPVLMRELVELEKVLGPEVMQLCESWRDA